MINLKIIPFVKLSSYYIIKRWHGPFKPLTDADELNMKVNKQ